MLDLKINQAGVQLITRYTGLVQFKQMIFKFIRNLLYCIKFDKILIS